MGGLLDEGGAVGVGEDGAEDEGLDGVGWVDARDDAVVGGKEGEGCGVLAPAEEEDEKAEQDRVQEGAGDAEEGGGGDVAEEATFSHRKRLRVHEGGNDEVNEERLVKLDDVLALRKSHGRSSTVSNLSWDLDKKWRRQQQLRWLLRPDCRSCTWPHQHGW